MSGQDPLHHQNSLYTGSTIETFTGLFINVFDPTPDMICIEDIAHGLSQMPRFGGQLKHFYSVAQHSLTVENTVSLSITAELFPVELREHTPRTVRLQSLMHDATEAYMMDLPAPIKRQLPSYKEVENKLMAAIMHKFGLPVKMHPFIKDVDNAMLLVEYKSLVVKKENRYRDMFDVEQQFLQRFNELLNEKKD